MFQLGVVLFLSLAVSLSSGQDVTLSESSSSSGTCNNTSCSYHKDSFEATVSCDVNTCFEAFNGSGTLHCRSSDSKFTCSQFEISSNLNTGSIRSLRRVYGLLPSWIYYSEPYACQVQGDAWQCPVQDNLCLCLSPGYDDKHLLPLLSIGFGFVLFFLPIIVFFNCNLASGPNHSFVFFYQCAPLISVYVAPAAVLVMQNFLLPDQPRFILLEYCKYIVVLVVILLMFFLVKCTSCPLQRCRLPWAKVRRAVRNFREKHIGSTFIHAICSIIVLSYGDLVAISVRAAHGLNFVNRSCCYSVSYNYSNDLNYYNWYINPVDCDESYTVYFGWFSHDIAPSVIISVVSATLLLPLPLSLIYYPSIPALFHKLTGRSLPRFPKLDPVFDVFQGVYKDKMRWFAGVHFLYLIILWLAYVGEADVIPFLFVIILAIHSLFQPFKNPKHNYLETLYLVYLAIVSFVSSSLEVQNLSTTITIYYNRCSERQYISRIIGVILIACLVSLPTLLVLVYCSYKPLSKCLCCQRCAAKIKNCCAKIKHKEEAPPEKKQQEEDHPYYVSEWST